VLGPAIREFRKVSAARPQSEAPSVASGNRQLIEGDSLAPAGHEEAVANFIEPQEGDQGAFFGEASKDGQAVFSILFVFKKPLEREGRVQCESLTDGGPRESAP
jgi:hypothetical protein